MLTLILAFGVGGTVTILAGALALGIRHGVDWDHIAAITDITSTTAGAPDEQELWLVKEPALMLTDERHHALATAGAAVGVASAAGGVAGAAVLPSRHEGARGRSFWTTQRRSLLLGTLYALGHGTVVIVLGLIAILASRFLPDWIDPIMERVVGFTLIFLAVYLFYSLYRYFRGGGEFRIRSRWMVVFAAVGNAWRWLTAKLQGREHQHVEPGQRYGARTAYGIGMIHGVGAETGTQVLVIATAVGAGSKAMSVATLFVFVAGLVVSNSVVTVATAAGFVSAQRRQWIYVVVGTIAAVFSLLLGLLFLFRAGDLLPGLDPYFRWIGGPEA